jgi:hypothetical protein
MGKNANDQSASNHFLGFWVPAFAGTTAEFVDVGVVHIRERPR